MSLYSSKLQMNNSIRTWFFMNRLLLFFVLCTLAFAGVRAADEVSMMVHQRKGSPVEVLLSEKPVAVYKANELVVTTTTFTFRFPLSNIDYVTYEQTPVKVQSVVSTSNDDSPNRIFDLNGRMLKSFSAGTPLQLDDLPSGTYIIKNNNASYKFKKK